MDSETTSVVFVSIMSLGFVVWLWSLVKALRFGRSTRDQSQFAIEPTQACDSQAGNVKVRGEPARISKALAGSIQQLGIGMFGSLYKITEHSAEHIAVEKVGRLICNQPTGLYFSEAVFTLEPEGPDSTKIFYRLGYKRLHRLLKKIALGLILGVGLPVLLIVGCVVWFFVIQSDQPSIRWQVFQTLQIVHVLWPPFLIMWAYSRGQRQSKIFVENLISSISPDPSLSEYPTGQST